MNVPPAMSKAAPGKSIMIGDEEPMREKREGGVRWDVGKKEDGTSPRAGGAHLTKLTKHIPAGLAGPGNRTSLKGEK